MSLVRQLQELKINNLIAEYCGKEDETNSFLLKTSRGKIVGIGWQVEDNFTDKEYFFLEKIQYINKNERLSGIMSQENWHHWNGKLFLINNSTIWHVGFNMIIPIRRSEDNLNGFIKDIKTNFPELRSSSELSDSELNELTSTVHTLRTQAQMLIKENEQLKTKIKELYNVIGNIKKDKGQKEQSLANLDLLIERLVNERDYFEKGGRLDVVRSLSLKQKDKLLELLDEKSLSGIEVNHHLLSPALIVKIPTTVVIEWDSPYDKVEAHTYVYQVIGIDGSARTICIEEIMKNPEAIVGSKLPFTFDDLSCCFHIRKTELGL